MKTLGLLSALSITLIGWAGIAAADPWKDESGKGRWRGGYERGDDGRRDRGYGNYREGRERRAYKEEYRQGGCKIERKWDDGEYKEEVKCKRGSSPYASRYYRY
ncbi:hypothetical protein FG93_05106 [Bosea sp. LC85]|uniref:hypothetical protein n=1 Tax=Bosea sp. LC85 TaxID=1502851 RepID=UPI0004E31B18|nr:hypothetical protein [Bosea sp. LC85]KFC64816.1 hypothetical protein FG93_05106 [Bosea sp. LC85]